MKENINVNFTTKKALLNCDQQAVGRAIENIMNISEVGGGLWAEVVHQNQGYEVISVFKTTEDSDVPLLMHEEANTLSKVFPEGQGTIIFRVEKWDAVINDPDEDEGRVTFFHVILDEEVITIN